MHTPPFPPAPSPVALAWAQTPDPFLESGFQAPHEPAKETHAAAALMRVRLVDLDPHLHCSIIGTCLSTSELRKLMRESMDVSDASDLEVHHEAVRLAGEIPGAYWAVMTHRRTSVELRQRAFGDVHMLSHLVGAANRADVRRLVALERENAELREQLERARERQSGADGERDAAVADRDAMRAQLVAAAHRAERLAPPEDAAATARRIEALSAAVALQAQRRESAEADAEGSRQEAARLGLELERLQQGLANAVREVQAVESELRRRIDRNGPDRLQAALRGRRILYVGGRPSATSAIRELVESAGGEFRKHDGGIEDRKGSLAPALAWSDIVVFPVDCIDHDSALSLKRDCVRHGRPFLPLRSAGVASFIVSLAGDDDRGRGTPGVCCLGHG